MVESESIISPNVGVQQSVATSRNTIKRKYEDALISLDEAVGSTDSLDFQAPPSKKPKTGRSLYSTLAKYGIKKDPKPKPSETSKFESLSKTAPHLAAILSRTATRTRKALPFKFGRQPSPSTISTSPSILAEYRPSSTTSFLARLATFKLSTYANKPAAIDAVAASRCGWVNDGKDRLVCGICNASWVVAGKDGMSRDAANTLVEKQRASLVDMHKDGCPWKSNQCDAAIYRVPLQTPAVMARELKMRADKLATVMQDVEIKHPLTSAQVQSLIAASKAVKLSEFTTSGSATEEENVFLQTEPSEAAVLSALFGWDILPPTPPSARPRTPSASRSSSVAPSSISAAPARATRNSVSAAPGARSASPSPSSRPTFLSQRIASISNVTSIGGPSKPETTLLHCRLCQRRVGLWAFLPPAAPSSESSSPNSQSTQPRRQLDVLKEHRSYCPYVVRSTVIPSFPVPTNASHTPERISSTIVSPSSSNVSSQPGVLEGWRAVWIIVTRYGALQRQRQGLSRTSTDRAIRTLSHDVLPVEDVEMEDEVQAMVAGVKKHGGRELLKYVKGLLG